MNIRFNIEKSQRKALAQKIGELAEMDVRYCGVPSCAYEIGFFTLSKDAVLSFADRMDTEVIENGVFFESKFRSATYFDLQIDGIKLLNTNFG